ncbi:EndoU domain-containing protein [Acidovorax sp. LjRoot74]|uniref:RHS repeat-associated core domain-containing protein n=1 Tax=Acidovorax sp. LjRoot74 TaxID=3342337 RepID=UPI003ECFD331
MTTTTMAMTKTARLHALWVHLAALLALLLVLGVLAPQARAQTTSITFFHNDVLGSPAVATDANGAVVWKESYLPYGHRLQAPAAGANNKLWYAGKQLDPNTGLSYMGARYYSPVVGRFMGMDPKGIVPEDPHSFNRYAYANNNPYKYVDPDGRTPVAAVAGIGILAIGGAYYALAPPSKQQEMRQSIERLSRAIGNALYSESAGSGDGTKAEPKKGEAPKPSLLDPKGETHVLDGDATGGGHAPGTGKPGKSEFPSGWSREKIAGEISDVATDPSSTTSPGRNGRTVVNGTRDGVDIQVIVEPNGRIVTGYPTNVPRNPR